MDDTFHSIGVTNELKRRFHLLNQIQEKKHRLNLKLVYYQEFCDSIDAIERENELNELSKKSINILVIDTNPMLENLLD